MRFGLVILQDERWSENARRWRRTEEFGFYYGWSFDHLGWRSLVDDPWFDSVPILAAAATVTTRLRLGTMVASPNFRHPVHFARELTALDDLSGGRLAVGIGAGTTDYDASVLGQPALSVRERVDRYGEFVELLDTVLRNDRTTWKGRYYEARDARSTPGCVQRPRVPFVTAANGPRSLSFAARYGQEWVTTGVKTDDMDVWWRSVGQMVRRFEEAMTAAGRDPRAIRRHLSLDASPVFSLSSVACFEDCVGAARELGFTDVFAHWPRASKHFVGSESVLEEAAGHVMPKFDLERPEPPGQPT